MLSSDCVKCDQSVKECEKNQYVKTKPVPAQINKGRRSCLLNLTICSLPPLILEATRELREMPTETKIVIANMPIAETTICSLEQKIPTRAYIKMLVGGAAAAVAAGLSKRWFHIMQPGR